MSTAIKTTTIYYLRYAMPIFAKWK